MAVCGGVTQIYRKATNGCAHWETGVAEGGKCGERENNRQGQDRRTQSQVLPNQGFRCNRPTKAVRFGPSQHFHIVQAFRRESGEASYRRLLERRSVVNNLAFSAAAAAVLFSRVDLGVEQLFQACTVYINCRIKPYRLA